MALMTHIGAGWQVRPYQRDDQMWVEVIFLDCLDDFPWRGAPADEMLRVRRAIPASHCLVAEEPNAGIIGFLTLEREKPYVAHLFVHREWRFCGVASGLLEVARNLARAPLELDVDIQNEAAIRAYKAMGWTEKVDTVGGRAGQRRLSGP